MIIVINVNVSFYVPAKELYEKGESCINSTFVKKYDE
jgi:hypothetical protein